MYTNLKFNSFCCHRPILGNSLPGFTLEPVIFIMNLNEMLQLHKCHHSAQNQSDVTIFNMKLINYKIEPVL